jgi:hypothetical protein
MRLRITFLAVGGVMALAGWVLLGFDATYLASFRLSRGGAVLPTLLILAEISVVAALVYRYRGQRSRQIGSALPVIWLSNVANGCVAVAHVAVEHDETEQGYAHEDAGEELCIAIDSRACCSS